MFFLTNVLLIEKVCTARNGRRLRNLLANRYGQFQQQKAGEQKFDRLI